MGGYDGRTAVITGASSGFGLAAARLLVQRGARVLITGRDGAALEAARRTLGPSALAERSDTASLSDIDALADRVRAELGRLDALIVNAGVSDGAPFDEMTEDRYDRLFAINTKGAYFTVQKLSPLIGRGGGIVLTTSAANVKGLAGTSAYAASKAALRAMARTLAGELVPRGVRVNAVSPGPVDTGILEKRLGAEAAERVKAQYAAAVPMQRMGRPAEIAEAMAFLAFEATYTTGAELPVDGGTTQL